MKMRMKITLSLLFLVLAQIFYFGNTAMSPFFREQNSLMHDHTPGVYEIARCAGLFRLGMPSVYAQEKRFEDYWDEDEGSLDAPKKEGYFNIFLNTKNFYIKAAAFVVLTIILYLVCWAIFRSFIIRYKSPAKTFTYSFLGFLLFVYVSAFICFSEYAMIQAYDENEIYIFQLNWMIILVSFAIWAIVSLILTYVMKGKA
jgi:hypothetical protein